MKSSRSRVSAVRVLATSVVAAFATCVGATEGRPVHACRFLLKVSECGDGIVGRGDVRGGLARVADDPNLATFILEVAEVRRSVSKPGVSTQVPEVGPFKVRVLRQKPGGLIQLNIVEGAQAGDGLALGLQYRLAYRILDLMLITMADKRIVRVSAPDEWRLQMTAPDAVAIHGLGERPLHQFLMGEMFPEEYNALPVLSVGGRSGWHCAKTEQDKSGLSYHECFVPKDLGWAARAVYLQASGRGPDWVTMDPHALIEALGDPNRCPQYTLDELEIEGSR